MKFNEENDRRLNEDRRDVPRAFCPYCGLYISIYELVGTPKHMESEHCKYMQKLNKAMRDAGALASFENLTKP